MIKIAIGADHRGFTHKEFLLKEMTTGAGTALSWSDVGAFNTQPSDYPVYSHAVSQQILAGSATHGVLVCATGVGMAIAANRYRGIYAALVWNETVARLAKEHDHANVIVIPADFVTMPDAVKLITIWLEASMLGGRYEKRISLIDQMCSTHQ